MDFIRELDQGLMERWGRYIVISQTTVDENGNHQFTGLASLYGMNNKVNWYLIDSGHIERIKAIAWRYYEQDNRMVAAGLSLPPVFGGVTP